MRANKALRIVSIAGEACRGIASGDALCEKLPVLTGLEDDILDLHRQPDRRITLANMAIVTGTDEAARYDFVILYDQPRDEFVVVVSPSHANDDLSIELERKVRRNLQLEAAAAAQAREIAETNQLLTRTNNDLVNFTRIISHDLKAPMRALRYSADDIEAAISGQGELEANDALNELRGHAQRLSQMVTDLLAYSRLELKSSAIAPTDTRALIRNIINSLPRPASFAINIRGDWPTITTAQALLDVALRNLIDNAIKHHDRDDGLIVARCVQAGNNLEFTVEDDGPGIPEAYRDAARHPFTSLQPGSGDTGGMGLALVDKVVSEAGGTLVISDRADGARGTCIAISWPLTLPLT